jgi:hypothetical protein
VDALEEHVGQLAAPIKATRAELARLGPTIEAAVNEPVATLRVEVEQRLAVTTAPVATLARTGVDVRLLTLLALLALLLGAVAVSFVPASVRYPFPSD